jgi:hypothetical protein
MRLAPLDEHARSGKAYPKGEGAHVQHDVGHILRPIESLEQGDHTLAANSRIIMGREYPDRLYLAALHNAPEMLLVVIGKRPEVDRGIATIFTHK